MRNMNRVFLKPWLTHHKVDLYLNDFFPLAFLK